ncbi:MAG: hypothetical protein ACKOEO_27015 [Planctomycetaceae bacterium]
MRNVIAGCKKLAEHELTADGRKNLQRHEASRQPPDPDVSSSVSQEDRALLGSNPSV